jgi:adenylate cyclase
MIKKMFTSKYAVFLLLLLLTLVRFADPEPIEILRLKGFDFIQKLEPSKVSEEIVLVDIGEPSIGRYGQWPWPRAVMASMINKFADAGATTVVLPIVFSEPDRQGGDDQLAKSFDRIPVIIAQAATVQAFKPDAVRRGISAVGADPKPWLFEWQGAASPISKLAESAAGVGMVATAPELDGVLRRVPMLAYVQGSIYPTMSLEVLRVLGGDISYQVKTGDAGVQAVRIPKFATIDTDNHARIWIKYNNKFQKVESIDNRLAETVKDKIVIVGLTAAGLNTVLATPVGGREVHDVQAQILQTQINGNTIKRIDWADLAELMLMFVFGLSLIFLVPRTNLATTLPVYIGYIILVNVFSGISYVYYDYLWDSTWPTIAGTLVFMYCLFNKYALELALKLQIKKQFGTYLSPALVAKLQKNPELLQLGGDSKVLSIMFTDVRGFTSISEHYGKDVQGLTKIMNRYMTAMTAKILENEGTLDKYIGDAQMAFWNAPLDDPNHAKHAVKTALEMMGSLDAFNAEIVAEGVPAFGMGLGINTAEVVVGNMGSSQRFDYTCLGDGVNLASRLEGQSKPYGVRIVIGSLTNDMVKDDYFTLELDCIAVKGKKEGVNIFTVLTVPDAAAGAEYLLSRNTHEEMLSAYRAQNWIKAVKLVNELKGDFDSQMDHYYDLWLERIEEMKHAKLPKDWDSVYRATSK